MHVVSYPARQARSHYRHELRTLTYVTLDNANGGIIRNLTHEGVAVQAVAALRPEQRVRLRFELRSPRLRVDTRGEVSWANPSGQCGIRFVDLAASTRQQIDQWIFGNLLEALERDAAHSQSIFGSSVVSILRDRKLGLAQDGLTVSAVERPVIRLETSAARFEDIAELVETAPEELSWLSRPLSGRTLAWVADTLVVVAAALLFALIFLSIAHELPRWPVVSMVAATVSIAAMYRGMFAVFGGPSFGIRLTKASLAVEEDEEVRIR